MDMDMRLQCVSPLVYQAMQVMDIDILSLCTEQELRPTLPYLVRMSLCAPVDLSEEWKTSKKNLLKILTDVDTVNVILALLSIDFHALEEDTRKEQQLRLKLGGKQSDSILISQIEQGLTREFEQSDADRKLRLVLSEILFIISKVRDLGNEYTSKSCELFEDLVYLEEVSDVLCIAHAELPNLLPITDLTEALLRVKRGVWIVCKLLANRPEAFLEVCEHVICEAQKDHDHGAIEKKRIELLESLCRLNPLEDLHIRHKCVSQRVMPILVLNITLQRCLTNNSSHDNDLVPFLTGLLLGNDLGVRQWFSQFIKGSSKNKEAQAAMTSMRDELLRQLQHIVPAVGEVLHEKDSVKASSLVRLYCALKGMATLKFTSNEASCLLKLLTCQTEACHVMTRFIQLSICMLLACPSLIVSPSEEKTVSTWIKRLMDTSNSTNMSISQSYRDMLFLIAIHFHSSQREAIADLVSNTLGMKSFVKATSLTKIRDIFTKDIFTEQVITTHAASLPITPNLSADIPGYLSVHSVYHLLKNRTFSKYKVSIKDWIYKQLCNVTSPQHPVIPSLIEAFIQSIILPSARAEFTNRPITEQEILAVFDDSVLNTLMRGKEDKMEQGESGARCNMMSQLLFVYYVLLYGDVRCTNMRAIVTFNRHVPAYSTDLINQLPISHVVLAAQKDGILTNELFASLLRLLTTHYPHLCLVEDWLDNTLLLSAPKFGDLPLSKTSTITVQDLIQAMADIVTPQPSYTALYHHLQVLSTYDLTDLIPYTDTLLTNLSLLLRTEIPRKICDLVKRLWFKLHSVIPRHLRFSTVKTLQIKPTGPSGISVPICEKDITVDPLLVLRCDPRVFRCPPLLEIILRILSSYLQECRVHLANHIQENPLVDKVAGSTSDVERDELKNALLTAQESAAVHILLESCLRTDTDTEAGMLSELQEIRCLVCSHLHQMFIADPNLVKLVHFQGYDSELLPITVAGVPSMHICLDFIPELISQPQMEKQMFAIELASHLCTQYALPKTMGVAKLAIDVMFTVIEVFETHDRAVFFCTTLPSLVRLCCAFPPLCEESTSLLIQIGRVTLSHLSATGVKHPHILQLDCSSQISDTTQSTQTGISIGIDTERYHKLYETVQSTFKLISFNSLVNKSLY